jgi:probable rRNA maturation factor
MPPLLGINNLTNEKIDKREISRIFSKTLAKLKIKNKSLEASLALVGDKAIRQLNKKYLHRDSVTDVLAFSEDENFFRPFSRNFFLGEIIISISQAKRQAKKFKHSTKKEVEILFVHGLAHLLGHDHRNAKEKRLMDEMSKQILERP